MESAEEQKKAERTVLLQNWLQNECGMTTFTMHMLKGDASFRRYFRIYAADGSYIAMDAPPEKEQCQHFVAIAKTLRGYGLKTPEIIKMDIANGFLLITDFGDLTYLKVLNEQNANELYHHALGALANLQNCPHKEELSLPFFDQQFMWQEWDWHKEWFLNKLLGVSIENEAQLDECYAHLVASAVEQPQVFMHRDFHSANLMVLPHNQVGILDFQDAFVGPLTYDLASLLRDCYIVWPTELVSEWAEKYLQLYMQNTAANQIDLKTFMRWFDLMSVQRHLKALITFARKHVRDGHTQYLDYIPNTLDYILATTAHYPELKALSDYYKNIVVPAFSRVMTPCVQ